MLWDSFVLLPGLSVFLHPVCKSPYFGHITWGGKKVWEGGCMLGGGCEDKGKAMAAGCTWEELKFRELPVATRCCSLMLWHSQSSGCQMQPAGEPISCSWQWATAQPWECLSCQMSTARDLTDLLLLWDVAVSYFRDQSYTRYYLYLFIHLCIFCPRLQSNQSWDINFSSEEFKWEPFSVPPFLLSK